jgi:hypothetical protein
LLGTLLSIFKKVSNFLTIWYCILCLSMVMQCYCTSTCPDGR